MKLDKESLIRNRFWVVLGVFVPLIVTALLVLDVGVAGELDKDRANLKAETDKLDTLTRSKLKGDLEEQLLIKKAADLKKCEEEKWKDAWSLQQGVQWWPKKVDDVAMDADAGGKSMAERNFGDPLHENLRARYAQEYAKQFELKEKEEGDKTRPPLSRMFREEFGGGIESVIFKDGWKNVIRYVPEWKFRPPSNRDIWLAQEDYWVQYDLLESLREANKMVARFKKVKPGEGIDPNDPLQGSFENAYWRLDLIVVKKDQGGFGLKGRISNPEKTEDGLPRTKREQTIGQIYFWLYLDKDPAAKPVAVPITGDRLAPGKWQEIREVPLSNVDQALELNRVEQVLESRFSPIKRIDQLALGAQSHRTYGIALKEPRSTVEAFKAPLVVAKAPDKGPLGVKPTEAPAKVTENGLLLQRYEYVSPEVRRLPVSLVLVVDQAHIPEVEAALAGSRLRFQITQVTWRHFRSSLGDGAKKDNPPAGLPEPAHSSEAATNLVELVVRGIVTLYERPNTGVKERPTPRVKEDPKKEKS